MTASLASASALASVVGMLTVCVSSALLSTRYCKVYLQIINLRLIHSGMQDCIKMHCFQIGGDGFGGLVIYHTTRVYTCVHTCVSRRSIDCNSKCSYCIQDDLTSFMIIVLKKAWYQKILKN
jgi:sulfatase maturation enzyme AslB (radical SAM superfamily)